MKPLFTLILIFVYLFSYQIQAQSEKKFKKQKLEKFDEKFKQFKKTQNKNYNDFVDQIDKYFADFLRKNWLEFQIHSGKKIEENPKPETFPEAKNIPDTISNQLELALSDEIALEQALIMPVNYKESTYQEAPATAVLDFYGDDISVKYVPAFNQKINPAVNPESIAQFWEKISDLDYRLLLNDLFFYKNKYALNDFGYYLLVKKFAKSITENKNHAVLITWYLMTKSKYKVKIGYNEKSIFLLLPSKMQVYGISYFDFDGLTYYVMDFAGKKLLTYKNNYELAYRTINFAITKTLKFKEDLQQKQVEFSFENEIYSFDFEYNLNAINFYKEFPQIELKAYFNSLITQSATESIIKNLKEIIRNMEEIKAVNFLLSLVQNGFAYKIDDIQFGREKTFFPEELLYYPFSDCEDRAIFFTYLVTNLLGLEVVGLDYPGHVATAVKFNHDYSGDFYIVNGEKYIVCDPTYINAPVGVSMKDLSNAKANLITKKSSGFLSRNLPNILIEQFKKIYEITGNIILPKIIEIQSGKIVSGNYTGSIRIQDTTLTASENTFFTAGFDNNNQLQWTKKYNGNNTFIDIIAENQSAYLLFNNQEDNKKRNILARMDQQGNITWKNIIHDISPVYSNANTQVTLYDKQGNQLIGKTYAEADYFEGKKLNIRNEKILVILPLKTL